MNLAGVSNRDWATHAVEAALDAIVTIDADGAVVYLNAAAEAMFGYERDEAVGRPLAELVVAPDRRAEYAASLRRLVERTGDSPAAFTGFVRDLTEECGAAARRSQFRRLLTSAEELAQLGSWALELPSMEAVWSDGMYRIHGLEPGSLEPSPDMLLEHVHPDDRPALRATLRSVLEEPEKVPADGVSIEYRAVRPDGTVREVRCHSRVEPGAGDRPSRWVGAALDVTEQRLTERELRAHYAVSQALRDRETFEEGVVGLLRRLATALELQIGELWTCDREEQVLKCRAVWSTSEVDADAFEGATLDGTLGRAGIARPRLGAAAARGRLRHRRRPRVPATRGGGRDRAALGRGAARAGQGRVAGRPRVLRDRQPPDERPADPDADRHRAPARRRPRPSTVTPARGSRSSSSSAPPRSRPTSSTSTRSSASATAPPPWPTPCAAA